MKHLMMTEKIVAVFSHTNYPGDEFIVPETPYRDLERQAIKEYLLGKKWTSLTYTNMREEYKGDTSAILGFLTFSAFRYYFPAFLLISLNEFETSDITALSVFKVFRNPYKPEISSSQYVRERQQVFSNAEITAIHETFCIIQAEYGKTFDHDIDDAVITVGELIKRRKLGDAKQFI
jgi:hypothetical protein